MSGLHGRYGANARAWAIDRLGKELGHTPSRDDIAEAILRGEQAAAHLARLTEKDRSKDRSTAMSVGYGIDSEDENERIDDYRRVRQLDD